MNPRFLSKDRVVKIIVYALLGFGVAFTVGVLIKVVGVHHITLEQIGTVAGVLSVPGSIVAAAVGWMRSQLAEMKSWVECELKKIQEILEAHEQVMNAMAVELGTHRELQGHPGIVQSFENLRGIVLRNEAQVEVFGRFQQVYEQVTKLSEAVSFLQGQQDSSKSSN